MSNRAFIPAAPPKCTNFFACLCVCVCVLILYHVLQNNFLSLVNPPETVLQYTAIFCCLCAGCCVKSIL